MIKDYALEVADKEGMKTGKFIVNKDNTRLAAIEVLETHLGLKGPDAEEHLRKYFDEVWNHFDVNKVGSLEAVELNHFMRDLCRPIRDNITLE